MQSRFSMRNYVWFIAAWMGMTFLYVTYWRPKLVPPPVEKTNGVVWKYARRTAETQAEVLSRMVLAGQPSGRGIADAINVAAEYAAVPDARVEAMLAKKPEPPRPVEVPQGPANEIVLGGPEFSITATLTDIGAGVRELILNHFDAADHYGLPERYENGRPKPVTLIPRHNRPPAFAVFHYAGQEEEKERPLDTLGRIRWSAGEVRRDGDRHSIDYHADVPEFNVRVTKTFSLAKREYHVGLSVKLQKIDSSKPASAFRYQIAGASGLPIEGEWYATTFRNAYIGMIDDRDVTHRVMLDAAALHQTAGSDRYRRDNKRFVYAAVGIQYFASAIAADDRDAAGQPLQSQPSSNGTPGKYPGDFIKYVRSTIEAEQNLSKPFLDDITVRMITDPVDVVAEPIEHRYLLYHGPVKVQQLKRLGILVQKDEQGNKREIDTSVEKALVERYAVTLRLSSLTDYGSFGWWTWAIVQVTNVIHGILGFLHSVLNLNGGLAILIVTVIVRGLMFPISRRQAVSMQRNQALMEKIRPEREKIDKQFKDDPMGKHAAMNELMRRNGINPMAQLGGCLMMIPQMPIFLGLYFALQENVFFRLEPFLWIRNLAAPDMLVWWGETIPYLTRPDGQGVFILFFQPYLGPYFNLLPIIGFVLIMVQQHVSMPKDMTEEQAQSFKIMRIMMCLMLFVFYRVPAGLSLYFIASSVWGLVERKLVKQHIAKVDAKREAELVNGKGKTKAKTPQREPGKFAQWWAKLLEEASKK